MGLQAGVSQDKSQGGLAVAFTKASARKSQDAVHNLETAYFDEQMYVLLICILRRWCFAAVGERSCGW